MKIKSNRFTAIAPSLLFLTLIIQASANPMPGLSKDSPYYNMTNNGVM